MEKSWKDAIVRVLKESDGPLHYTEITDQILSLGYYETDGATPTNTVISQLTASLKGNKEDSPFLKVGRGIYTLKGAEFLKTSSDTSGSFKKKKLADLSESDVG